jgi:hypothetical protein
VGLTGLFALYTVTHVGGKAMHDVFTGGVYDAVLAIAVVIIVVRGIVRRERAAWLALGVGLALWATADTYYSLF